MGIRWAESGSEGRNRGWRGRNRGWKGRGAGVEGAGSLERLGREIDFLNRKFREMAVLCLKVILRSTKENMHICVDYFVTRPT